MPPSSGLMRQAAAIPVQNGQVCLVSSRSGKRWVVPKGCMEPGKSAGEIALQEAWEEAGLAGRLEQEPIGSYFYEKAGQTCHVIVFVLQVIGVSDNYPEKYVRDRLWTTFTQAISRVDEPGLRDLIRAAAICKAM